VLLRRWYVLALFVGVLVATPVAGCASDEGTAKTKTETVERTVTVEKPPAPKKDGRKPHRRSLPKPPAPEFVSCDSNIEAEAGTTTCPFAQNVFWTYWTNGESSEPAEVWSPAAQASFATTCGLDGTQVVCNASDNATVKFPTGAVDVYSQDQADAYASTHDLGPENEGVPPPNPPTGGGGGSGGEDCQGYDPCINPGPDVDCEGGEGNGPRYVAGPVDVDGADPYGLDSNYDGVGCEYR
jgi:hypothetical protein